MSRVVETCRQGKQVFYSVNRGLARSGALLALKAVVSKLGG
jgi:hypothetical protein